MNYFNKSIYLRSSFSLLFVLLMQSAGMSSILCQQASAANDGLRPVGVPYKELPYLKMNFTNNQQETVTRIIVRAPGNSCRHYPAQLELLEASTDYDTFLSDFKKQIETGFSQPIYEIYDPETKERSLLSHTFVPWGPGYQHSVIYSLENEDMEESVTYIKAQVMLNLPWKLREGGFYAKKIPLNDYTLRLMHEKQRSANRERMTCLNYDPDRGVVFQEDVFNTFIRPVVTQIPQLSTLLTYEANNQKHVTCLGFSPTPSQKGIYEFRRRFRRDSAYLYSTGRDLYLMRAFEADIYMRGHPDELVRIAYVIPSKQKIVLREGCRISPNGLFPAGLYEALSPYDYIHQQRWIGIKSDLSQDTDNVVEVVNTNNFRLSYIKSIEGTGNPQKAEQDKQKCIYLRNYLQQQNRTPSTR